MTEKVRRRLAWAALVVGVVLALLVAGPLDWGLGLVLALALTVGGAVVVTDRRPVHVRQGRPYDFERDPDGRWWC